MNGEPGHLAGLFVFRFLARSRTCRVHFAPMPTLAFLVVPLGQLVASALACGINLYATVGTLALASRYELFGWTLPADLRGLENRLVIGSAAALYLLEFLLDKVPFLDSAWDAIHTIVRPLAAAALIALALVPYGTEIQIAGGVLAGGLAFLAHATKAGVRVIVNRRPRRARNIAISLAEDALAVTMALLALTLPVAAIVIALIVVAVVLFIGPIVWRAGALGMRALAARIRGFFGLRGWRSRGELPWRLRPLVEPEGVGRRAPVTARAGLTGLAGLGAYRNGWLVFDDERRIFLYTGFLRPRRIDLGPPRSLRTDPGILADTMDVEGADEKHYTLFLLKDGPGPERIEAEFRDDRSWVSRTSASTASA